ncbi:Leucine-rich repeat-containing protein 15, partial [Pseudolycoriella hygida]
CLNYHESLRNRSSQLPGDSERMKVWLVICSILVAAVAQEPSLSCVYSSFGDSYRCELTINNPNGLNNFTEIDGIHLTGFTDEDVDTIYRRVGVSTNVPQIICDTFSNIRDFELFSIGITEVDDNAFRGCSRITTLYLSYNSITSISENAFATLRDVTYMNFAQNLLTTLPENVFANQQNLTFLHLSGNRITELPSDVFRPLENLLTLSLGYSNLTAINSEWFSNLHLLDLLDLSGNRIALSPTTFNGLEQLSQLYIGNNAISEIPVGTFAPLSNLRALDFYGNSLSHVREDSFSDLQRLTVLDLAYNQIREIDDNAFRGLEALSTLYLSSCGIQELNPNSFQGLQNLTYINLNFNAIEEILPGTFNSSQNLNYIGLWNNRLKTLRRNAFGSLIELRTLDLDGNIVNALDRAIIDDAVNLNILYFDGNLCANGFFGSFSILRAQHLPRLERCFENMRFIVDTTTENDGIYSMFEAPNTGIVVRVRSDSEVQIALVPFEVLWIPSIEIFLGSSSNTRSVIRINEETDVVTVPTPNIIQQNQWNDFRITWVNQNVLVFSANETYPFMSYTMQTFFPVNFYGLRAVLNSRLTQDPSVSCVYYNFDEVYGCQLTINNPNGFNNFTAVAGIHLEGFTGNDVNVLFLSSGNSPNIPEIICETFPNVIVFDFYNAGVTQIDDDTFRACSSITQLHLYYNRISSISSNAFASLRSLRFLDLGANSLSTIPENVFANQQNLTDLSFYFNAFQDLPSGVFRPLTSLEYLHLGYSNASSISGEWFTENPNLFYLYLAGNGLTLSPNMFAGMSQLGVLSLNDNAISEIPSGTFSGLPNLQALQLYRNNFSVLEADSFPDLQQILILDVGNNPIGEIRDNAFRGLDTLQTLYLSDCRLNVLDPGAFEGLGNVTYLDLNFNELEGILPETFVPILNLNYIGFWNNRLKTLRRNSFGSLEQLRTLDLDGNVINAIDRAIIDDAVNLNTLYFSRNLCASGFFGSFSNLRAQYLPIFERCFENMRYIVDTTTENDGIYSMFEAPNPGIVVRVRSDNEVQIVLAPFRLLWTPLIEIFLGSSNNTRSVIRINEETDVVTVPTRNIIQPNQWNDFRITWVNQNVLVFSGNETYPFMSYTMQTLFPVNFYGLRAVGNLCASGFFGSFSNLRAQYLPIFERCFENMRFIVANKMKWFIVICTFLAVTAAQNTSLSCSYYTYGETYGCEMTINNPNGLNNFTEIGGIHLEGFTANDVNVVYFVRGNTPNIPEIICETFPNVILFDMFGASITQVDDNSFSACSSIEQLYLYYNRISSISSNAFASLRTLRYLHLGENFLSTLPENVFANLQELTDLSLFFNNFQDLPVGVFRPLTNLQYLNIGYANLSSINGDWFTENTNLSYLNLAGSRLTLSPNMFAGMDQLIFLSLNDNGISEIPSGTFSQLTNLQNLQLYFNNFSILEEDSFPDLQQLVVLDIGNNPIGEIRANAFRGLGRLSTLYLSRCGINVLNPDAFEGLGSLTYLDLNFNEVEGILPGTFAPLTNLNYLGLWNNRVKTLRRNIFGSLEQLSTLDLDGNIVNAVDRAVIDDAVNLNTLYFSGNLCANGFFGSFSILRAQYLPIFERCFQNMRYIVDTTTENDGIYSMFEAPNPGIVVSVRSENEVQIVLSPFEVIWTPSIEVFLGSSSNTRSVIRINEETDVVTVPTPNIIQQNRWNDFRITWVNQNVLVFRGNETYPFMSYTMQTFFPVNFYGLRAVETSAIWSVQPVQ